MLVMAGSIATVMATGEESIGMATNVGMSKKTLSPNDMFDLQKIKNKTKDYSKQEAQKKYEQALKDAFGQYIKALQEIEIYKANRNLGSDEEINLIKSQSYYHRDDTADDGSSAHGGSGVGNSDAWIDRNEIHVWSRAEGPYGVYWAHGRVWDRFTYNAEDHWCRIEVNYYLKGRLTSLGGDGEIKIYLRVYDVTDGKEVEKKLIFSDDGNKYYDNELKSGVMSAYLKKGHTYDIELIAESEAVHVLPIGSHDRTAFSGFLIFMYGFLLLLYRKFREGLAD